jgi:hypothetical protein
MGEPARFYGVDDVGELGLASPLAAMVARSEAAEARADQRAEAERKAEAEDRAEARLHFWMVQRARQLMMEGKAFDPTNPASMAMSMEEQAERVGAMEDREAARAEFRAKVDRGELHVLDIPADAMAPVRPEVTPESEELADAWAGRMQAKTQHAGVVARIRRGLMGKVGT